MKKLLTVICLLMLLVVSGQIHADTWTYTVKVLDSSGAEISTHNLGNTSNADDSPTFTVTLTSSTLDPDKDGTGYFKIGVKYESGDNTVNYALGPSGDTNLARNSEGINVTSSNGSSKFEVQGVSAGGNYTITFVSGAGSGGDGKRNQGTVSITGPEVYAENSNVKLITAAKKSGSSWQDINYNSFASSTGIYSWTITATEAEAGKSSNNNVEFKLHLAGSGEGTYYTCPSGNRQVGTSWSVNMTTSGDNAYFKYDSNITSYEIQAKLFNSNWHVRVIPTYNKWYLHSNLGRTNDWDGETDYKLLYNPSTGFYEMTLDQDMIRGANDGDVRFRIYDQATGSFGPLSTYKFTSTSRTEQVAQSVGQAFYYSIPKTINENFTVTFARIEAKYAVEEYNVYVQLYVTLSMEAKDAHDYYWVSPQVTNNQKLETYKMVASRNRSGTFGDGMISTRYYSLTMKADDIRKYDGTAMNDGDKVQWYIVRDDNEVWYRPTSDDPTPTATNDVLNVGDGDNNVGYRNFENCRTTDSNVNGLFSFPKGHVDYDGSGNVNSETTAVSYTFILNAQRSSDANQGHVYFNYAKAGAPTNTDYYLIGNFNSASEAESININDTSHSMVKYWYKNGAGSTSEVADADSIVYKIDVQKPEAGWGNLYLDVNPSDNTDWGKVYRPLISLGNTLDGRALVGGVTTAGSNLANAAGDQSLNPETTDNYTGYTFSFNATTYTYRLEFHTSLYLVGDGVSASETEGSWNISNVESSDPRIRLNATQEAGHYRNRVYFTQGKQFRFIRNTDETDPNYQTTWHENDNAPKFSSATEDSSYTPGNETQYKNFLTYQTDGSGNTAPSSSTNNITFDLPTGWYYINFYENTGSTPYYIIERQIDLRDFNNVHYKNGSIEENRTIIGRGDYNFFRVWSDHIAWTKPDDIDVFVVTQFSVNQETGQATAVLTKQSGDYIPAKTGVILASKDTKDTFHSGVVYKEAESGTSYNTAWMDMTPAEAPAKTYGGDSKLTPLYNATNLQRYENVGGTEYANYLFGFYRLNKVTPNYTGENTDFGLGFWLTTGVGNTYANSAFLRILKTDAENLGVGTTYTITAENSSAPAFFLVFEDEPEPETVTAIQDVRQQHVGPEGWFTLNGLRVTYPTAKGVYIHNGKKVVVK